MGNVHLLASKHRIALRGFLTISNTIPTATAVGYGLSCLRHWTNTERHRHQPPIRVCMSLPPGVKYWRQAWIERVRVPPEIEQNFSRSTPKS
jgi:hypothetical protein